jgi:hypothetical protein
MDYSLLFAVEKNSHFRSIRGNTISRGPSSHGSEEDAESYSKCKIILFLNSLVHAKFDKTRHTFLSSSGRYIYHIAIIDYLQDYNLEKKLENRLKVFINKEGA